MAKQMKVPRGTARRAKRKGIKAKNPPGHNPEPKDVQRGRWLRAMASMTLGMRDRFMARSGLVGVRETRGGDR
jgi:hypothetical protein